MPETSNMETDDRKIVELDDLTEHRSRFVYNAVLLAAQAVNMPIIPMLWWDEQEEPFKEQFCEVIKRQCGDQRSRSPEELYGSWTQAYFNVGWVRGTEYSRENKTDPDLMPYAELGQFERDKYAMFVALCEIARQWVYSSEGGKPITPWNRHRKSK